MIIILLAILIFTYIYSVSQTFNADFSRYLNEDGLSYKESILGCNLLDTRFGILSRKKKVKFKYFLMKPENYIILRVDNIGEIPPNTTVINIDDGKNSRTIVLNSDLGMSEAIRTE